MRIPNECLGEVDDPLTKRIIGLCFSIQNELGHGFVESVYHQALIIMLRESGIPFESEVSLPVWFHGEKVGDFRADLVVDGRILIELKSIKSIAAEHIGQTINYLKASGLPIALLINFGQAKVDLRRIRNPFIP